jgi:Protein of unknown function (DUF998)
MRLTRIGIALFVLAVAAGPTYTVSGYSSVSNLISELAAQNTQGNYFMSAAFIALGAAIAFDGSRSFGRSLLPFMAFGFFMFLAGVFGHKPITPGVPYSALAHSAHSALATAAGVSISVAFIWQAIRERSLWRRVQAASLAIVCFALPLGMLSLPAYQGAIQRLMYAVVFLWLWVYYPRNTHA